jgi:hypothetical protein
LDGSDRRQRAWSPPLPGDDRVADWIEGNAVVRVKAFLSHIRERELDERVSTLTARRSRVIDAVAQQRLVALVLDLGMAKQKMDTEPVAARALVDEPRGHATLALGEMRERVRGFIRRF